MSGQRRIAHLMRLHHDRGTSPHRGSAALELVDRQVDSIPIEGPQRGLDPLLRHKPLHVAVLTARMLKQLPIGTGSIRIDGSTDEREEVGLPALQAPAQDAARLLRVDRMAQKTGQPREETPPDNQVAKRDARAQVP